MFLPQFQVLAGGDELVLSYVAEAESVNNNITIPATAQIGDFALFAQNTYGNEPQTNPAGWTQMYAHLFTWNFFFNQKTMLSRKVLVSGDPGKVLVGGDAKPFRSGKNMIVLRPNRPIASVSVPDLNAQTNQGGSMSRNIPSGSGGAGPIIAFASVGDDQGHSGNFSGATWTRTITTNTPAGGESEGGYAALAVRIFNETPANQLADTDFAISGHLVSGYLKLT